MSGRCVVHHFQDERSDRGQGHTGCSKFLQRLLCSSVHISPIHFIWYTHTTHEFTMCSAYLPDQKVKGDGHMSHLKFLLCPLCGFLLIWANHLICGIHKGAMCPTLFSGRTVKGQSHTDSFEFWPCPLCGFVPIWLNQLMCGIHTTQDVSVCRVPFLSFVHSVALNLSDLRLAAEGSY